MFIGVGCFLQPRNIHAQTANQRRTAASHNYLPFIDRYGNFCVVMPANILLNRAHFRRGIKILAG